MTWWKRGKLASAVWRFNSEPDAHTPTVLFTKAPGFWPPCAASPISLTRRCRIFWGGEEDIHLLLTDISQRHKESVCIPLSVQSAGRSVLGVMNDLSRWLQTDWAPHAVARLRRPRRTAARHRRARYLKCVTQHQDSKSDVDTLHIITWLKSPIVAPPHSLLQKIRTLICARLPCSHGLDSIKESEEEISTQERKRASRRLQFQHSSLWVMV